MEQSSNVQLNQGNQYQATLILSGFEVFASNRQVADRLKEIGFTGVIVTGHGSRRYAVGTWTQPSQVVQVPQQVRNVSQYLTVKSLV